MNHLPDDTNAREQTQQGINLLETATKLQMLAIYEEVRSRYKSEASQLQAIENYALFKSRGNESNASITENEFAILLALNNLTQQAVMSAIHEHK